MEIVITDNVDKEWWDDLVSSTTAGGVFYTARWAEMRRSYLYTRPYFLTLKDGGKIKAIAAIEARSPAHNRLYKSPFNKALLHFMVKRFPVLKMRDWIFLDNEFRKGLDRNMLAKKMDEAFMLKIRPLEVEIIQNALDDEKIDYSGMAGERKPSFAKIEWATFVVRLGGAIKDIEQRFKNSARKALRKAAEQGLCVERIYDLNGLRRYHAFLVQTTREAGMWVPPFTEMEAMWKGLRKPPGVLEIFAAKEGPEIVGGISVWGYNGIVSEFGSIRSRYGAEKNLYIGDILKWEVIKWANSQGFRYYDLEGVSPDPENQKESSIRQFKEKWGGEFKRCDLFKKAYPKGAFINAAFAAFKTAKRYKDARMGLITPQEKPAT